MHGIGQSLRMGVSVEAFGMEEGLADEDLATVRWDLSFPIHLSLDGTTRLMRSPAAPKIERRKIGSHEVFHRLCKPMLSVRAPIDRCSVESILPRSCLRLVSPFGTGR